MWGEVMRILHLLQWPLNDITDEVMNTAKRQGFDVIQINPIQPLKEDTSLSELKWWMSYQPCDLAIGNQYGSKLDLINCCDRAKAHGLKIVADVIVTHMAEEASGTFEVHHLVNEKLRNNPYFWKEKKQISNWHDRYQVINYNNGLPGLCVDNYDYQDLVIEFLNSLIDCGVDGFRFDSAKSIALPEEGCDFFPRVLGNLKRQDLINYVEILYEADDFLEKYGRFAYVLTGVNARDNKNSIIFGESHDTFYGEGAIGTSRNWTPREAANYYEMLCYKYENTLFFARPWDNQWKMDIVKAANINNQREYTKEK